MLKYRNGIMALVVLALVLSACSVISGNAVSAEPVPSEPDAQPLEQPRAEEAPIDAVPLDPQPGEDAALPNWYKNLVHLYAFSYPLDWYVWGDDASAVYLTSYDPNAAQEGKSGGVAEGEAKIDFIYVGDFATLDEMMASQSISADLETMSVERDEQVTLQGGIPARMVRGKGQLGDVAVLYTVINGKGILAAGYGDTSLFDAIVLSLSAVQ